METAPIVIRWTGMRCAESSIKRKPGLRVSAAAIIARSSVSVLLMVYLAVREKGTVRRNELRPKDFLSCFG